MPVGKTLAAARRAQGKTLSEIQAATRIMGRKLDALEHERWADLPAPVYVKGYIQNYADALGLDPEPLLAEYASDIGTASGAPRLERIPGQTLVPHQREVHAVPQQVWLAVAAGVIVLLLAACGIVALLGRDDSPPPIPPVTTLPAEPATTSPGITTPDVSIPTTAGSAAELGNAFTLNISVAADSASWVRVAIDGAVEFEGTLEGGEQREYSVASEAVVRIGKPQSVTVTRDGRVVEVPLGQGIAEVRLTANE